MNTIFAGFVKPRPYPETGLSTAQWMKEVRPRAVKFSDLWLTQETIKIDLLFLAEDVNHSWSGDPYPHVVSWQNKLFLEDDHNRITRAALRGWKSAHCRVFEHEG